MRSLHVLRSELNALLNGYAAVTNGDAHDHADGDGGQIAYSSLSGLPPLNNFAASSDPGPGDDSDDGYSVGSWWWNITAFRMFRARSVGVGAAVWVMVCSANGTFIEATTTPGLYAGYLNTTPRVLFADGTAARNWQIDNYLGAFRWFLPGVVHLALSAASLIVYNKYISISAGGLDVGGTHGDPGAGNIYSDGNISGQSFTDRTPAYSGDALSDVRKISAKDGMIDHNTLPAIARATIMWTERKHVLDESGKPKIGVDGKIEEVKIEKTEPGRDLGGMISVLTAAVQRLTETLEKQGVEIENLKKANG
jgi:hypothetical protein